MAKAKKKAAAKARAPGRAYLDHPPAGTASDQTTGFTEVLIRLYKLEDGAGGPMWAEARAICERFLPPQLTRTLRVRHG